MTLPNPLQPFIINVSLASSTIIDDRTRRFVLVSSGDTSQSESKPIACDASNWKTIITSESSESGKFASSFFAQEKAGDKIFYVVEVGSSGGVDAKLKKVEAFIDKGTFNAWMYVLPSTLLNDAYLKTLLTKYSNTTSQTYFMGTLDNLPDSSTWFNSYGKGQKSLWANYNNLSDSNASINGVMAGIMASASYDISSGNRMSPFNHKRTPNQANVLSKADVTSITNAPANFCGLVSGEKCALNGRFADGKEFSYWFSGDSIQNIVTGEMNKLVVDSANIPNSPLTFNNLGISIAEGRIITALESCQALGYIDTFGSMQDPVSKRILNQGSIASIDAETFITQNPTKYESGIYDGFSAFIRIQRYIAQIQFNVTFG